MTINGTNPEAELNFSLDEYAARLEAVKAAMADAEIDLLLLTDPANMYYLTGYDAWSFYTHQVVAVSLEHDVPLWIGRGIDAANARFTAWLPSSHVIGYPDEYVYRNDLHAMDFIACVLADHGWTARAVGVEMDAPYFTASCLERVRAGWPDAKLVDADRLVNWVRVVKSPAELAYMQEAAEIARLGMDAVKATIGVGVRECDVVAATDAALISGTEAYGGAWTWPVMLHTGARAAGPHLMWRDKRYVRDTATNVELGGNRHRYCAGLCRTVYLGEPRTEQRELAERTIEAANLALEAFTPGTTCEEIEAVWQSALSRWGLSKPSRIGYSLGIGYAPAWPERSASLAPGDTTALRPGMTFHAIFGMWMSPVSFTFSETVAVTETGNRVLTSYPRELLCVDR